MLASKETFSLSYSALARATALSPGGLVLFNTEDGRHPRSLPRPSLWVKCLHHCSLFTIKMSIQHSTLSISAYSLSPSSAGIARRLEWENRNTQKHRHTHTHTHKYTSTKYSKTIWKQCSASLGTSPSLQLEECLTLGSSMLLPFLKESLPEYNKDQLPLNIGELLRLLPCLRFLSLQTPCGVGGGWCTLVLEQVQRPGEDGGQERELKGRHCLLFL